MLVPTNRKDHKMSRDDEGTVAVDETTVAPTPEATPDTTTDAPTNGAEVVPSAPDATAEPVLTDEEKAAAEKAAQDELDALVATFEKVAQDAVDSADSTTAELPEDKVNAVKEAFAALPAGSPRTQAKKWLNGRMRAEIGDAHIVQAKAFMTLEDSVRTTAAARPPAAALPPADPTEEHVKRATALFISANFAIAGPDVASDWPQRAQKMSASLAGEIATYRDYLTALQAYEADPRPAVAPEGTPEGTVVDVKGEAPAEPEVSDIVRTAAKIAQGRVAAPRKPRAEKGASTGTSPKPRVAASGERRDIKAHIEEVFRGQSVGTFIKYGDVARAKTSIAPDGDTSSGAISARMKSPRWDDPSLVHAEKDGVQGIRKVS